MVGPENNGSASKEETTFVVDVNDPLYTYHNDSGLIALKLFQTKWY